MYSGQAVTQTTPLLSATALAMSSVMLRGWSTRARIDECDAMTGFSVIAMTSQNTLSEAWETSTIMPRRFISATTSRPKSLSPSWRAASVAESAQLWVLKWVSDM